MSLRTERLVGHLREALLTVGALLGVCVLVAGLVAIVFDLRFLTFRSGSMAPSIETGALAIAREVRAADLEAGDVVSVRTTAGSRVTHRIMSLERDGHLALLRLRGDANQAEDAETYRVARADVVLFDAPALGRVLQWASGSTGRLLLGLYAAFVLLVLFRRPPRTIRAVSEERLRRVQRHVNRTSGRRARMHRVS